MSLPVDPLMDGSRRARQDRLSPLDPVRRAGAALDHGGATRGLVRARTSRSGQGLGLGSPSCRPLASP